MWVKIRRNWVQNRATSGQLVYRLPDYYKLNYKKMINYFSLPFKKMVNLRALYSFSNGSDKQLPLPLYHYIKIDVYFWK